MANNRETSATQLQSNITCQNMSQEGLAPAQSFILWNKRGKVMFCSCHWHSKIMKDPTLFNKFRALWIFSRSYVEGRGALRLQIFSDSVERGQKGFARQMVIYGSSIDHILTDAEYNRDISRSLQLKLTRQIKANINNYGGHLVKSTRGFWTPRQLLRV